MIKGILAVVIAFSVIGLTIWYTDAKQPKQKPTQKPQQNPQYDVLTYSKCEICRNARVPRKNNIMNFLYIGQGTCMQYWLAGQRARLPTHMCNVVQFYSYHTCGCEIAEPNKLLEKLAVHLLAKDRSTPRSITSNFSMVVCDPNATVLDVVSDAIEELKYCPVP